MAIYRAESSRRIVVIGVVALVVGLVLGLAVGRATAPTLAGQLADLRTQAAPIRSSLEVVRTEYPKLLAGGADTGGASAAMARIKTTFETVSPSLDQLGADRTDELSASIEALAGAIDAKAPAEEVQTAADAVTAALDAVLPAPVQSGD